LKNITVRDLMVPRSDYPVVREEATIYDAVHALQEAQKRFDPSRYRHRAVLVADSQGNIIGKLGQLDMLRALEPKYEEMRSGPGVTRLGFSRKFLVSMLDRYDLFAQPIEQMCRHVFEQKVTRYMQRPGDGEKVEVDASLEQALHQLLVCQHQSLLVMESYRIIGILRLTDVFTTVFETIDRCMPPSLNREKR
jgi:CBS domain containing-hemolysin-like protein